MTKAQKPGGAVTVLPPEKIDGRTRNGRVAGTPNKITRTVREMVVEALDRAGQALGGEDGTTYLQLLAHTHPAVFAALIGKIVPAQIEATVTTHETVDRIERVIIRPAAPVAQDPGVVVPLKRA